MTWPPIAQHLEAARFLKETKKTGIPVQWPAILGSPNFTEPTGYSSQPPAQFQLGSPHFYPCERKPFLDMWSLKRRHYGCTDRFHYRGDLPGRDTKRDLTKAFTSQCDSADGALPLALLLKFVSVSVPIPVFGAFMFTPAPSLVRAKPGSGYHIPDGRKRRALRSTPVRGHLQ
ncbi:hypothetical protein BDP67DRAFT_496774 [Colletotrichum lupini]|nr:hypothetical protein BDP67DRAFT_496774 [Colletotrichum lupini]